MGVGKSQVADGTLERKLSEDSSTCSGCCGIGKVLGFSHFSFFSASDLHAPQR